MSENSITNNANNLSELNWELIFILNDIHQYLDFKDLIKISLMNKLIRLKLNNKIFNGIELNYSNLSEFSNFFERIMLNIRISHTDLTDYNFKDSITDPFVTELSCYIAKISNFSKSLTFFSLSEVGYYIIPLNLNFSQLSRLEISNCTVDLSRFIRLMPKLSVLECLSLSELNFVKLPTEEQIELNIMLPETLKELSLSQLYISTTSITNSPYEFIYNFESSTYKQEFYLPPQPLHNLEKFKLKDYINNIVYINEFLALNLQLSHFSAPLSILNLESIEILSLNNNLKHIEFGLNNNSSILSGLDLPPIHSLISLYVSTLEPGEYPRIFQSADSFANLIKMDIKTKYYNIEFITTLMKKLTKLKFLSLKIEKFSKKELDFSMYSQIETLKISFITFRTLIYKFPHSPSSLSSIYIYSGKQYIDNYNSTCEASKSSTNWRTKLLGKRTYCYTING